MAISNAAAKAAADAVCALANGGSFVGMSAASVVLVTFTLEATAFDAATTASPAVAVAASLPKTAVVGTSGTVTKGEVRTSGAARVFDVPSSGFTITKDGAVVATSALVAGQEVTLTDLRFLQPVS